MQHRSPARKKAYLTQSSCGEDVLILANRAGKVKARLSPALREAKKASNEHTATPLNPNYQ